MQRSIQNALDSAESMRRVFEQLPEHLRLGQLIVAKRRLRGVLRKLTAAKATAAEMARWKEARNGLLLAAGLRRQDAEQVDDSGERPRSVRAVSAGAFGLGRRR